MLDHRTVHRFLAREDEARIRGRKSAASDTMCLEDADDHNAVKTAKVATPKKCKRAAVEHDEDDYGYRTDGTEEPRLSDSVRRSSRKRNPSLRLSDF